MIYLRSFHMLSDKEDEDFFYALSPTFKTKNYRTGYTSHYPFVLFRGRGLPDLEFDDITILYGDNGSGKSTILNVIAEKLKLRRTTPYNRSDFFDDYVELCSFKLTLPLSDESGIITSDDVFDKVLDIRRLNAGIDNRRSELITEFVSERSRAANAEPNNLRGLDDYERWKEAQEARSRKTTQSQYLRSRLMRNVQERSNGESALAFFVDSIADGTLCLLDEPENSLSPTNQVQLRYFIEDCVRNHKCQFVISTHSPLLLSLRRAKIYDIDALPIRERRWTALEGVRVYHDFFTEHREDFE
ncbi:MAG: AAA family ATPase [Eubacteriales bacterium]|jgi:predicted ATPase|nr:AAA family ATPase [Eubacteriales bacterium]